LLIVNLNLVFAIKQKVYLGSKTITRIVDLLN